jgi:hypothetical protein
VRAEKRSCPVRLLCYVGIPTFILLAFVMYSLSLLATMDNAARGCGSLESESGARNVGMTEREFPPDAVCLFADGTTRSLVPLAADVMFWGSIGGIVVCFAGAFFLERRNVHPG